MKQFLKKLGYEVSLAKLANYREGSVPVPHASCPPKEADKARAVAAVPVIACALLPTTTGRHTCNGHFINDGFLRWIYRNM